MNVVYRKTCRVCGSSALNKVINLGDQCLQGSFVKPGIEEPPTRKIATTLVRCDPTQDEKACGLLQMSLTLPPEILYSAYWYRSGTNQTMRDHLRDITSEASLMVNKPQARVLDIGANDGTLLKSYPPNFVKYGIDPSDAAQNIEGDITIIHDLFPSEELLKEMKGEKFDIVTAIAMFYDLEDPVRFVREIKRVLAQDGLWVFEMSYMPSMLKMNSYDTICHEHLEYYSLAVVENILKRADMRMVRAELNDINGGSIRCFATHIENFKFKTQEFSNTLRRLRQEEFDSAFDTDKPYRNFQNRINAHKRDLVALIKKLKRQGKKIHIYGASTKGNTILQFCGIDKTLIPYAADRNPDKHGARTLGTDISIISEAESRAMKPDYYLVLPWHFKNEFIQRERESLEQGIKFIFPFPKIEIIGATKTRN